MGNEILVIMIILEIEVPYNTIIKQMASVIVQMQRICVEKMITMIVVTAAYACCYFRFLN